MEHLNTNLVVSKLNLTCFFIEMNDTYDYSDPLLLPISLPSFLLHESRPYDDHIYVHVHVDVIYGRQVVLYANLGCTLAFAY
jgi:hypothetical protein